MKKYFLMAVAAIAVLSSCSNEDELVSSNKVEDVKAFTATIVNENASRAILDGTTPSWEIGDVISVNGCEYTASAAGTTSTFTGTGATGETYETYFPASLYNGGTPAFPAIQTYAAGKFNMPMYAESTTTELAFKNLCAVLAVKVTSDDIATLKSIKVSSDKAMCGAFTISDDAAVLTDVSDNSKAVELVSVDALTMTSTGTTFYIAIPAREYSYLNIYLSADGTTYTQAMATRKALGLGVLSRSSIFNIDYKANATQLWAGGPLFADVNVGVTNGKAESSGGYYCWGGSTDKSNSDYYTGSDALSGDNDTATKLWGSNWRMPTSTELGALINSENCNVEWITVGDVNGRKYIGMADGYTNNSIFLPAAGACDSGDVSSQGTWGFYWSSTPDGGDKAFGLRFISTAHAVNTLFRKYGYSVRAVLAE